MKGHINQVSILNYDYLLRVNVLWQNCPNRYNRDRAGMDSYDDCDRCGLGSHKTNVSSILKDYPFNVYHST